MKDWYSSVYKSLIISGCIAFIISFFTEGMNSLGAYVSGYIVFGFSIMMLLITLFNHALNTNDGGNNSTLGTMTKLIFLTGPFLCMLFIIIFILTITFIYKDKIIEDHVPGSYHSFCNINIMLLFLQLYFIYTNISDDKFFLYGKISKVVYSSIYLLCSLSLISCVILYTILKYYSTDGFTV